MAYPKLFRRLVWGLFPFLAALAVWTTWVVSEPSAYREEASHGLHAGATWPDGSPRTDHDWWAHGGQPPAPSAHG